MDGARFAVLSLGDSSYEFYCEAGKRLDRRFEELAATRLNPRIDCDIDYEEAAAAWSAAMLDMLAADRTTTAPAQVTISTPVPSAVLHDKDRKSTRLNSSH